MGQYHCSELEAFCFVNGHDPYGFLLFGYGQGDLYPAQIPIFYKGIDVGRFLVDVREAQTQKRLQVNRMTVAQGGGRSEEHTSELQSRPHLVCRLLLEKKKKTEND